MTVDWPTIAVMVSIGGLLWRQLAVLSVDVRDVDRRLARLEGWIEGERAGRAAQAESGTVAP